MILELVATFCTAIFAGAAVYINLVEHPARIEGGTAAAVRAWRPTFRRASLVQAAFALGAVLGCLGAWMLDRQLPVLIAGICIGFVIPYTLVKMSPTNRQLEDPKLEPETLSTASLLSEWNRLHKVRTAASSLALVILLLHLADFV